MEKSLDIFINRIQDAFAIQNEMTVSKRVLEKNCPTSAIEKALQIDPKSLEFKQVATKLLNLSYSLNNGLLSQSEFDAKVDSLLREFVPTSKNF